MYPEAYRLFTVIMNKDDKKIEKIWCSPNLHKSSQFGESSVATKIRDHQPTQTIIPTFKYVPKPLEAKIFETGEVVVCDCCQQQVDVYYTGGIYAIEDVDYLCPTCIHSGDAAQKYDGSFQQDLLYDEQITNPLLAQEVLYRTPGYVSWQGNNGWHIALTTVHLLAMLVGVI